MGNIAGPLLLHLSVLAAGLGVLRLAGARADRPGLVVAFAGLAYLVGLAAVLGVLILLLVVGVPFTFPTILVVALVLAAPAFAAAPVALRALRAPTRGELLSFPVIAGVILALLWLYVAVNVSRTPLTNWDGWAIWTYKARIFAHESHIPLALFQSTDRLPIPEIAPGLFPLSHFDYPLGFPLWQAAEFRAVGKSDTSQVMSILWILVPAWAGGVVALAPRRAPRFIVLPIAAGTAALLIAPLFEGLADVPLAMFLSVGLLALGRWLQHRARPDLVLAVVLLGGAASFKNEGIVGTVVIFAALLVALAVPRDTAGLRQAVVAGAAWLIAFVLPWKAWLAVAGVHGDLPYSRVLNPVFLVDNLKRFDLIGEWLGKTLLTGGIVATCMLAIAVLVLARGPAPRIRLFAALAFGLYALTLVLVYWVTAHDLYWHIGNSIGRVLTVLSVIGVAAILLVTEPVADAPDGDETDRAAAGDGVAAATGEGAGAPLAEAEALG